MRGNNDHKQTAEDRSASGDAMGQTPRVPQTPRVRTFSMTDEEGDLLEFQAYLLRLSPEELWDVHAHLDNDRYPRRSEAVRRELLRRRLFGVSPFTANETRLRNLFGACAGVALFCILLRAVAAIHIDLLPGERLPFFYDLAAGGPKVAQAFLPFVRMLGMSLWAASIGGVVLALWGVVRRRVRGEVLGTGIAVLPVVALLLWLAR